MEVMRARRLDRGLAEAEHGVDRFGRQHVQAVRRDFYGIDVPLRSIVGRHRQLRNQGAGSDHHRDIASDAERQRRTFHCLDSPDCIGLFDGSNDGCALVQVGVQVLCAVADTHRARSEAHARASRSSEFMTCARGGNARAGNSRGSDFSASRSSALVRRAIGRARHTNKIHAHRGRHDAHHVCTQSALFLYTIRRRPGVVHVTRDGAVHVRSLPHSFGASGRAGGIDVSSRRCRPCG